MNQSLKNKFKGIKMVSGKERTEQILSEIRSQGELSRKDREATQSMLVTLQKDLENYINLQTEEIIRRSDSNLQAIQIQIDAQAKIFREQNESERHKNLDEIKRDSETLHMMVQELIDASREKDKKIAELGQILQKVLTETVKGNRTADEAVWAQVFNNTISQSTWLKDRTFSPGRWAVGYPFLYVMYRVLDEFKPRSILELGLGQSTTMIAQYAHLDKMVSHYVVEHDEEWIEFFQKKFEHIDNTKIIKLNRKMIEIKNGENVRVFDGFADQFSGLTFDFISIDAPLGGDMKSLSRIDILDILPESLAQSFVIMMDDYERAGEQHTMQALERILRENDIPFIGGNYRGAKDFRVVCSPDNKFICTL